MKHIITILAITMVSGAAFSGVVFTDDFSSFAPFDPSANPVNIWDNNTGGGTTEQWLTGGASSANASDNLVLATGGGGQSRGLAYVLDPTQTSELVAGDYTVSIDVINQFNVSTFEFFAFEGVRDDTGVVNTYALDLLSGVNGALTHTTLGTGNLTLLDSDTWTAGAGSSGTVNLTFSYDGTDDLVVVMNQRTTASFLKTTTLDNFSVSVVPEPATISILGLGALVTVLARRLKL